jgi:hypothetical protein
MTPIELKKIVLQQISEINDISFLSALHKILETRVNSNKMKLKTEQLNEILTAKKEIELGLFKTVAQQKYPKTVKIID